MTSPTPRLNYFADASAPAARAAEGHENRKRTPGILMSANGLKDRMMSWYGGFTPRTKHADRAGSCRHPKFRRLQAPDGNEWCLACGNPPAEPAENTKRGSGSVVERCLCGASHPGLWTTGVHHGARRCARVVTRVGR